MSDRDSTEIMIQHLHIDHLYAFVINRDDVRRMASEMSLPAVAVIGSSSETVRCASETQRKVAA